MDCKIVIFDNMIGIEIFSRGSIWMFQSMFYVKPTTVPSGWYFRLNTLLLFIKQMEMAKL